MNEELIQHGFTVEDTPDNQENWDIVIEEELSKEQFEKVEKKEISQQTEQPQEDLTFRERQEQQRHKNKNPFRERIGVLTHANKTLQHQLAEKERLLAQREYELRNRELSNERLHNSSLQAEEQTIVHRLKTAKEEGDIDTEIKLQQDLARVKSEQMAVDVMKLTKNQNSLYQPPAYDPPTEDYASNDTTFYPEQDQPMDSYQEPLDVPDEYLNFMERNPWINQNSGEFSPELAQEANEIAADLNKRLIFNNQSHLIASDAYYSSIEKIMNEQYGLSQTQEEPQVSQKSQVNRPAYAPVSGVSRAGASMADQYAHTNAQNRPVISLTPEEYRIARNLQVPHPTQSGKYLSSDEAVREYAKNKTFYAKQAHDPKYRITM